MGRKLVIYESLYSLSKLFNQKNNLIIAEYIKWEFQILENLGYGLDVKNVRDWF